MTPAQCRAARAIVGLSQDDLAKAAGIGVQSLIAFEGMKRVPYTRTIAAIRVALEAAGVEFIEENGSGPGVRLRKGPERPAPAPSAPRHLKE